jgi:membrane-associated protease RseP (regulator of RpoE activity)
MNSYTETTEQQSAPTTTDVALLAGTPDSARPGESSSTEPVVLRDDPAPVRLARRWRRAGQAEGRNQEWHAVRAIGVVIALGLLWAWQPGAIAFVSILTALVFVHELGHYVVARRVGMAPTDFFVGFGPTVWARTTKSGLRYGVKILPAGGFVKIPGMGPRDEVEASREAFTYRAASRRNRLAVILAGVAVNFVVAVVLFAGFAVTQPGVGPTQAVTTGFSQTTEVATGTLSGLGSLVFGADDYARSVASGEVPENRMMSPIGGAQVADGLLEVAPGRLLLLAGIFSASLALLNLLPLLPLDGGHAALVVIESAVARIRRRPTLRLDPNRFTPVAVVVLVVLLSVSASAMYLDILYPLGDAVR